MGTDRGSSYPGCRRCRGDRDCLKDARDRDSDRVYSLLSTVYSLKSTSLPVYRMFSLGDRELTRMFSIGQKKL